jgi:hypothetical protein
MGNGGNGSDDGVFADLERFRAKSPMWVDIDVKKAAQTTQKRKRKPHRPAIPVPYGSIPYAYTDKLQDSKAHWTAWALLFHFDRLIYGPSRKEPLTVSAEICRSCRFTPKQVRYALRQLERAGLVAICRRGGRGFIVSPLWRIAPATP